MRMTGQWAGLDSNSPSSGKPQPLDNKEPIAKTGERPKSQEVHNPVHILEKYPELADLITRWPSLPEHIKEAIKALIKAYKSTKT
ncbi:MAG: hypothetical protein NTX52_04195 [Planctomycetota bacterium]|nr:hypothetical protein [Planctomycetota bacterium]